MGIQPLDVLVVNNRWQTLEADLRSASKQASEISKVAKAQHFCTTRILLRQERACPQSQIDTRRSVECTMVGFGYVLTLQHAQFLHH